MYSFLILCIPFLGTTLGAAFVFLMIGEKTDQLEKILLGFSSGVMLAASVWSLLLPAIDMSDIYGTYCWVPAATGFLLGIAFLYILEGALAKYQHRMFLAVTIHNIPEGMAVGVACAGIGRHDFITLAAALALSIGIAIQNIPEGAIISMPLKQKGFGRGKAFGYGVLSGSVEPAFGLLTLLLTRHIIVLLPFVLSFAAGVMFYVIVDELVPEASGKDGGKMGILSSAMGFVLMMILDVVL